MKKILLALLVLLSIGLSRVDNWNWIDTTLYVNQLYLTAYDMEQSLQWMHNTPANEVIYWKDGVLYEKRDVYKENNPFLRPFIHDPAQVWGVAAVLEGIFYYRWRYKVTNKWQRRAEMLLWTALEIAAIERSSRTIHMAYKWSF